MKIFFRHDPIVLSRYDVFGVLCSDENTERYVYGTKEEIIKFCNQSGYKMTTDIEEIFHTNYVCPSIYNWTTRHFLDLDAINEFFEMFPVGERHVNHC